MGGSAADRRVTLTLKDNAEISNNIHTSISEGWGGGVYLGYGDFTMSGSAKIINNTAKETNTHASGGGGVYVRSATGSFFFKGGVIKDNTLEYATYGAGQGAPELVKYTLLACMRYMPGM